MKFMMLMIPAGYHGNTKPNDANFPDRKQMEKMGKFNDELGKVFKIIDLNGLHPLLDGARVKFSKGKATMTDGPFVETKEVIGGYWLLEAPSKEEVLKWAQKCPAEDGDIIEVRQVFELDEIEENVRK